MALQKYDLIVIGSGPAGEKGAAQVAYFGKRVALIEREPYLGGAGANTGTLPSKTLRETALFLSGFRQRDLHGIKLALKEKVSVPDLLVRERFIKEGERSRVQTNMKRHKVELYRGDASFVDPHTVVVKPSKSGEIQIQGDTILIATGSYPVRPALFPFHDPRVYDSDTILTLQEIPQSMLVVGGGVIGSEYACMFAALGIRVTLVDGRDHLMPFLDGEISESLKKRMQAMGVAFMMPDSVESVHDNEVIEVRMKSGAVLKTHTVVVASGRSGNTEGLGLDKIGITLGKYGVIPVNEKYQTSVPHIYAAGDVIGSPALASTSMEQARIAMVHAFDLKYKTNLAHILPYGIYTIPECSMAGKTEEELRGDKAKNIPPTPCIVGKASYAGNARGQIIGDSEGFLKLIFRDDEKMQLLGVHMIGEQATEVIHIGLTALLMDQGPDLFIQTCYNYPTLSELYKYATYDALGKRALKQK